MLRRFAAAFAILALCVGVLVAGEYKAKVTKVDGEKKVITVMKEGGKKDINIKVGKNVRLVGADGKFISINDVKEGAQVGVTTEEVERTDKKTGEKKKVDAPKEVKLVK